MKHLFVIVFTLIGFHALSQGGKEYIQNFIPDNIQRYKLDYEIKNVTAIDSTLVLSLNIDQYESLRLDNTDVEVTDIQNSVIIVLYSVQKCQQNKRRFISNTQGK